MDFKSEEMRKQFAQLPDQLKKICYAFADISEQMGVICVVTRVIDPVPGDSGVHEAHRAVDFRNEYEDRSGALKRLYDEDDVNYLVSTLNQRFPRKDGRLVCSHHSFKGGMYHFHLQIPVDWIN